MNDLLGVGPPDLGPGLLLLMGLSTRTAINDELNMMVSWFSPYVGDLL